ncbi:MAG: DUF1653 domain-containing protein [Candidatus Spechtbacterales bacterium]|nr:DUF1653 domain-containing protein [Candidatus Spechtbacterales bacterium]
MSSDTLEFSKKARDLKMGKYRHFKGAEYEVLGIARHSETQEELVVYKALYGDGNLWARPIDMFIERVEKENYNGPRFKFIK